MIRVSISVTLCVTVLLAAGCPHPPDPVGPTTAARKGPDVQAFTEASSVRSLAVVGGYLFVGTSRGVDRWDLRTGEYVFIGKPAGLPGESVITLSAARADQVWIGTDGGVALYDIATESVAVVPPPIPQHARAQSGLAALVADPAGGAWLGGTAGLYHVDLDGVWRPAGWTQPVTALHLDRDGALWLGTRGAVVMRAPNGTYVQYGEDQGFEIAVVRQILEGPSGEPLVLGEDREGSARIALVAPVSETVTTYTASPVTRIASAARVGDQVVLATSSALFTLAQPEHSRTLARDVLHLTPIAGKRRRNPFVVGRLAVRPPPDPTVVTGVSGNVIVGTRALGVARVTPERGRLIVRWLRRRELVAGALDLSVACVGARECYVATGANRIWRYDGLGFREVLVSDDPTTITLAVVRSNEGEVIAIHRTPEERKLRFSRLLHGRFDPLTELLIETPGGVTGVSFAKFSPDGQLWLGLQYLDEENESRPWGVATVDLTLNVVTYHGERRGNDAEKSGILPVPNDVVDAAFSGDETWFASQSGAVRLHGDELTVYTEAEGLESELLHGVVATEGGLVFVGARTGIGVFDGNHWAYPRELRLTVSALGRDKAGRLWMGTERGVVAYDGSRIERIDRRGGLLEDRVEDLAVDHLGRVWTRSRQGFSLVVPKAL